MNNVKTFKKIGTHNGRFHADEVMATAILNEIFEIELVRTRDMKILRELDIVYDVGGGEFDHHDLNKVYREDGVPYAACGLIWNSFGREVVEFREPGLSGEDVDVVFRYVERVLIEGIDAVDNGIWPEESKVQMMEISRVITNFNPPWYMEKSEDEAFNEALMLASRVLVNTITNKLSVLKAREKILKAYNNRIASEILVLDLFCPFEENLRNIDEAGEVLYVIYPNKDNYAAQTVRGRNREDRKPFPPSWAGKKDSELSKITGVDDAVFCHSGRFIAVAGSFEGIMSMVEIAIREPAQYRRRKFKPFDFVLKLFEKR